jgi:flavin-dependent dehydrogenase
LFAMVPLIKSNQNQSGYHSDRWTSPESKHTTSEWTFGDGARIGVVGGGPAGSFFSFFFLSMVQRVGIDVRLDIFERRDFSTPGPSGCNMCGGIISESLVQTLAVEGINLPPSVVERGIDSYVMHFDEGKVQINPPGREKRIAAVHRGAGPKGIKETKWESFDGHLLDLAKSKGANVVRDTVDAITLIDGRPNVKTKSGRIETYDLLVIAAGVNTPTLKLFDQLPLKYKPPRTTKTYIAEFYLGQETVERCFGNSMHVFLLHIPRLEFAALVPKGDYVTMCLLGREIDDALVRSFMDTAEVRSCLPPNWELPKDFCHCNPKINVRAASQPFADRMVFIGDSGTSRLYKDGIGAAYRTAKAAATTAVFHGVSEESFKRYFLPVCKKIELDNRIGKLIFTITRQVQRNAHDRRGILRMVSKEQMNGNVPHMSAVLWDTFTGSAPYKDIFLRSLHPGFLLNLCWEVLAGYFVFDKSKYQ